MASFVPDTFWADSGLRGLPANAQLVYLWICSRANKAGVVSPWDAFACGMEVFGTKVDKSKVDKMLKSCEKAGAVCIFKPSPSHDGYSESVVVARWATVAPHIARGPIDGEPYPTRGDIETWERARKLPFRITKPSKHYEPDASDQEMELANSVWIHWVTSRAAARPDALPAILDHNRIMCVVRMLRNHVTVDALKLAVDGCYSSPWHMGQNPNQKIYDQIELIFRDAAHFERFAELGRIAKGSSDEDYVSSVMREMRERKRKRESRKSSIPSLKEFE